ncbi:MAG: aspartyl protease family protein [Candidatus Tumulicola sp.]
MSLLLAAVLATAQPQVDRSAVRATRVLQQAYAASGGDRWASVKSLRFRYDSGLVELDDVVAGRFVERSGTDADGFDGISRWTQGKSGIAYVLGDRDSQLSAANDSYRTERAWWFASRHPGTIAYAGKQVDRGATFDTIQITPEGGRPFTLWIDARTHLIARDVERGAEEIDTTTFSDYRWVDGIRIPFAVQSDDDPADHLAKVEINAAFAEDAFAIPPLPKTDIAEHPVTVPFRVVNEKLLVPVYLNGQGPFDAEFDTGGNLIVPPALLQHLKLIAHGGGRESGGGEGSIASSSGAIDSVSVGDAKIGPQQFSSFPLFSRYPERMLVGLEVLQRYVVALDFDKMQMTLTPPSQYRFDGTGTKIPFHFQDNQPEVTGSIDGIAAHLAIDTGDDSSLLLTAPFAQRYDLIKKYNAHLPYGGTSIGATHGVWADRAGTVSLDDSAGRPAVSVTKPVTRISTQEFGFDANRYVSANVGIGILQRFNLTFDYADRYIVFQPNANYGNPDVFNRVGIDLSANGAGWKVRTVYPNTAASRAGLRVGQVVVSINGQNRQQLADGAWYQIETGPVGSHVTLAIQDAATTRTIDLILANDAL